MGRARQSLKLLREFVWFARDNGAYWIVPLMLVLGLVALVMVASEAGAPLIYTLF